MQSDCCNVEWTKFRIIRPPYWTTLPLLTTLPMSDAISGAKLTATHKRDELVHTTVSKHATLAVDLAFWLWILVCDVLLCVSVICSVCLWVFKAQTVSRRLMLTVTVDDETDYKHSLLLCINSTLHFWHTQRVYRDYENEIFMWEIRRVSDSWCCISHFSV